MRRRFYLIFSLLVLLTACLPVPVPNSPLPTLTLLPTDTILPTATATSSPTVAIVSPTPDVPPTLESTFTLEPTITEAIPQPTLDVPPTLEATSIPQPVTGSEAIQFYSPGPLSKLITPVVIYGYAIPGYGNKGFLSLYGEDGRLLDSEILQLNTSYTWAYFYWTLDFEIQGAGELGRLTLVTKDEYGRLTAGYSVHLILLPGGFSIINPPGDFKQRCVIQQPAAGDRIAGGKMSVTGGMRPFSSTPLVVELFDRAGNVLAAQSAAITPALDDSYVPFQVDLSYTIPTGTWARLTILQPDDRIAGTMYLYSQEVFLNP